jgi:hypothetical protein
MLQFSYKLTDIKVCNTGIEHGWSFMRRVMEQFGHKDKKLTQFIVYSPAA